MTQWVQYMQLQIKLKIRLTLVTFLGGMESNPAAVSTAETSKDKMEEEMDESLLDESEEELIARMAASANPAAGLTSNKPKESCHSDGSVGNLSVSFMKNVVVGSNEVFTAPNSKSSLTNPLSKGVQGPDQGKQRGGDSRGSMRWSGLRGATG